MFLRYFSTFRSRIVCILIFCLFVVVLLNYIYLKSLISSEKEASELKVKLVEKKDSVKKRIEREYWSKLSFNWPEEVEENVNDERWKKNVKVSKAWRMAESWVNEMEIYPADREAVGAVLNAMSTAEIIKADVGIRGTQLKLTLTLQGGQLAVFKPMRYERDAVFEDAVYSGADRHNGEIAAFHLSNLLGMRWSPLVVGRKVRMSHLKKVSSGRLRKTFFTRNSNNRTCFYGVCYYCKPNDAVCSSSIHDDVIEGALILWLPTKYKLKMFRHPWARTYRANLKAKWELDDNYCLKLRSTSSYDKKRLLDLIDVSIFDFLIGNGDRHRYETIEQFNRSFVLLLDNGKSFGNPNRDEISILAPLYQCCMVRSSTLKKLESVVGRGLSVELNRLLRLDPTYPVLNSAHLLSIDRRRLKVISLLEYCFDIHSNVLI
ncbi:Glycosaminoglycan xylosylkinase [Chamberlinius hualienensis]